MQNANLTGTIQRPEQEIAQKLDAYFQSNGLNVCGQFDRDGFDGNYSYQIRGTFDEIKVIVAYYDFRPQKKVMRDIMALDERISDVDCTRLLSSESYREKETDLLFEPIFVSIDGVLQQTTWYEFVNYQARNIDYTKKARLC